MALITYSPIEVTSVDGISVERHEPDYNDPAWQTFYFLTSDLDLEYPGVDEMITCWFCKLVSNPRIFQPGTVYANPCGVLRCESANRTFIRLARQIQRDWFRRLNDVFGPTILKGLMKRSHGIIRQLTFTGVLFIDNRHVVPHCWPDLRTHKPKEHPPRIEPGRRFGLLVVLGSLPEGRLQCKCDCGKVVVKYRKHLVSEQTISCGCRQAKRQERQRNRRRDRGWKHTGKLGS